MLTVAFLLWTVARLLAVAMWLTLSVTVAPTELPQGNGRRRERLKVGTLK